MKVVGEKDLNFSWLMRTLNMIEGEMNSDFLWVPFFEELSNAFLMFEERQTELIDILNKAGVEKGFEDTDKDREKFRLREIDPFSAWALILKYGDIRKIEILSRLKSVLDLTNKVPDSFSGVPSVHAQQAWFFPYSYERPEDQIPMLWELFKQTIVGKVDGGLFKKILDYKLVAVAKITGGMFCANPSKYLPINLQTRPFLTNLGLSHAVLNFHDYEEILKSVSGKFPNKPFYEISYEAWLSSSDSSGLDEDAEIDLLSNDSSENDEEFFWQTNTLLDSDAEAVNDLLNRKAFSKYLAGEINDLMLRNLEESKPSNKSTIFNIYGAWGSGKTTFVNMVKTELKSKPLMLDGNVHQWMTVDFNAWRCQHIRPVWWSILSQLSFQLNSQVQNCLSRIMLRVMEWFWRFQIGYGLWILIPLLALWILVSMDFGQWNVENLGKFISLIAGGIAVMGSLVVALQVFLYGGSGVAKLFQTLHRDPHIHVVEHFNKVLNSHSKRPVLVFIDDLDRCKSDYVVSLLESLHTLLSNRRVFYIVAADRGWISTCFDNIYEEKILSPERTVYSKGFLFLEKIFQLSICLPRISSDLKSSYIDTLLGDQKSISDSGSENTHGEIKAYLEEAVNEDELAAVGSKLRDRGYSAEKIAEVSTEVSGSKTFKLARKHRLTRFACLMDTNPRNIKLLINAYGIYINLYRVGGQVTLTPSLLDQIALWVILNIRFPRVAEFIESDLSSLNCISDYYAGNEKMVGETPFESLPSEIKLMLDRNDVKRVILGITEDQDGKNTQVQGLNKEELSKIFSGISE